MESRALFTPAAGFLLGYLKLIIITQMMLLSLLKTSFRYRFYNSLDYSNYAQDKVLTTTKIGFKAQE